MKVVCAQSVLCGLDAFSTLGEVAVLPDRKIGPADLRDADALVIRSKTTVDAALLAGSRLRYVGTATAGFDHLDLPALEKAGVNWFAAAGCNANSVAEYVAASLLWLNVRHAMLLQGRTLGVIGVGQVGRRVVQKAGALGLRMLQNDPPRRLAEGDPALIELDAMLPELDVVTLHVPLIDDGPFPTRGMVDCRFLSKLKPGAVFINASRGEVVDEEALLLAMDRGVISQAILDVWDHEPCWSPRLGERVAIGTPHIAGYSYDGKLAGTDLVYRDMCQFFEKIPTWDPYKLAPPPEAPSLVVSAKGRSDEEVLWEIVHRVYDLERDDRDLRGVPCATDQERGERFDLLRKNYPSRREFMNTEVTLEAASPALKAKVCGLGFKLAP